MSRRAGQLRTLSADLATWSIRDWASTGEWFCDGALVDPAGPWARERRVYVLTLPAVTVPDDWPLDESQLELSGLGYGMVELSSAAAGPVLLPINEHHARFAVPARRFAVRVTAAPLKDSDTGYVTVGAPWQARLVRREPSVVEICRQLRLVADAADAVPDSSIAQQLLELGENAVAGIHFPSGTNSVVPHLADREYLGKIWTELTVDDRPEPMTHHQRQLVARAATCLGEGLATLVVRQMPPGTVNLCGTAHIDIAWLWPESASEAAVLGHFAGALHQLDRFPEFRFAQSGAHLYRVLERSAPDLFEQVKEQVQHGRWDLLGGMWVEPDVNLPNGESLVRQLLYAQRYFESRFGRRSRVGWLPDSFGFSGALPQLLATAGIQYFFTTKMRYRDTNPFPFDLFRWTGIDGTSVLAYGGNGPQGYRGIPEPGPVMATWNQYRQTDVHDAVLLPVGHSSGITPTDDDLENARLTAAMPGLPATRFVSVEEFFDRAASAVHGKPLPEWSGALYLEAHRGTYTTQGRTKFLHRRAEADLLTAEVTTAMAAIRSQTCPPDLGTLWYDLLDQQAHDVITGTSIAEVHAAAEQTLAALSTQARALTTEAVSRLAAISTPGHRNGVLLANPSLTARRVRATLPVDADRGQSVDGGQVVTADTVVPPLGVRWLSDVQGPGVRVQGSTLENEFVRVNIADGGTISSLWDKGAGRELLAGPANLLRTYLDRPQFWDAWELSASYRRYPLEHPVPTDINIAENGPHRAALRIDSTFRDSTISQEVRLWSNSARVDIATTIDWHERRVLLRADFPVAVRAKTACFECAFGVTERATSPESSLDRAQFEVPAHRFIDLSDDSHGIALLNNGRHGHSVDGNVIGLSLLRSPLFPDPFADEGLHHFTYSLFSHPGNWWTGGVLSESEDLNSPLPAIVCAEPADRNWQALSVDHGPVALSALKAAENGGLILRVYEPTGSAARVRLSPPSGWSVAADLNLLEDVVGPPTFDLGPFEIRSWLLRQA